MDDRRRILFVEDDAFLLEALREAMADMAGTWDMAFVGTAEAALEALAGGPFDAVVADLWLPGMQGAQFLQRVQVRYPSTVRFVLSASGDRDLAMEVVDRAHQFLRKPCDPAILKSALRRTFELGAGVRSDHVRELVTRVGRLPSVPTLYQEITRLLESERATVENLGTAIGKDMAMTAMTLKLANSAFFSLRHAVSTPAEAISILGVDLLRSLVLAHGLFTQTGAFRLPHFGLGHLWRHSVTVAALTRQIAAEEGVTRARCADYFTAGLLHDAGILVLASRFPEAYARVLDTSHQEGLDLEAAEFHVLGATHGEVGAFLLGLWGLPPAIVDAAGFHHEICGQTSAAFTPALAVHAANAILAEDPEHEVFATARLDENHLRSLGYTHRIPAWRACAADGAVGLMDLF